MTLDDDDRCIVDQSSVHMRVATFAAGIWLTYVVCATSAVYVVLTWDRPHRALIASMFGAGVLGATIVSRLPRERIVRSRYREAFFLAWSVIDIALIIAAASADGGAESPLTAIFFIPVVFAAMSYPLRSVALVAGLTVAAYLSIAFTIGGSAPADAPI